MQRDALLAQAFSSINTYAFDLTAFAIVDFSVGPLFFSGSEERKPSGKNNFEHLVSDYD
jgi:hypothetical protein